MPKKLAPVHPGEILTEDFLKPMGLSAYAVATAVGVPRARIERVARGETSVTADTALRLGKFFGMSAQFWMNAQVRYDLETAEDQGGKEIAKIKRYVRSNLSKVDAHTVTAAELEEAPELTDAQLAHAERAHGTSSKRGRVADSDDAPELDSRFFERSLVRNAGKIVKRRRPKGGSKR